MISTNFPSAQQAPVVMPQGRFDATNISEFDQALQPLFDNHNFLIIDFSQCTYLSSAGIRVLLVAEKRLLAAGGGLFLCALKSEIFQILEIAGLLMILRVFDTLDAAQNEIERIRLKARGSCEWSDGTFSFQFHQIDPDRQPARLWKDQGIAGYNELGMAIGIGTPCEAPEEDELSRGLFISNGHCAGFIPNDTGLLPDFRIPHNPANASVYVTGAISFSQQPAGLVQLTEPSTIRISQLADGLYRMKRHLTAAHHDLLALVIADFNPEAPSVSICLLVDADLREALKKSAFDELSDLIPSGNGLSVWGGKFLLDSIPKAPKDISLSNFLNNTLNFENIVNLSRILPDDLAVNPISWMFLSNGYEDAASGRVQIETDGNFPFEPHKAFLTRRLFTDSARLMIKQLHGGYSAQTYQVTSFDRHGRKLRPTVLKIASRALITRESERCQQYALPYILNNSAIVLGTEFFGDTGALRYNFVGIGGEHSQIKWLTHYFTNWPPEKLIPLFDKIFLQILNPWYGQPLPETIYPYRDHDPTFTFFPALCETAESLFKISSDEQYVRIEETDEQMINPYWFLKHEFARRRETGIGYQTSVCHGDLNMQNILLDEDMNVYLIDFSETRPRSVVSDFARLEAIFMIEHAPMADKNEMDEYARFLSAFYGSLSLVESPAYTYHGAHPEVIARNVNMTRKMREYALKCAKGNPDPVPYYLALLEWILPVVCYTCAEASKRFSMIAAARLCELVRNSDE